MASLRTRYPVLEKKDIWDLDTVLERHICSYWLLFTVSCGILFYVYDYFIDVAASLLLLLLLLLLLILLLLLLFSCFTIPFLKMQNYYQWCVIIFNVILVEILATNK